MLELSREQLVLNIAEQTGRAAAIIGHADFTSGDYSAAAVIASMAGNIFDSAATAAALEDEANPRSDCYSKGASLLLVSGSVPAETKGFIARIKSRDARRGEFTPDELLDLLNDFDCFMFWFFKSSPTVRTMTDEGRLEQGFMSLRNIVEKQLRKSRPAPAERTGGNADADGLEALLRRNNELLEILIDEIRDLKRDIRKKDN